MADHGIVDVTESRGRAVLRVRCLEPLTKSSCPTPPYERELLESAIAACRGAAMRQVGYEHIPCPADFGDEQFDHELEITPANVLALRVAQFTWSEAAERSVAGIPVAEEEIAAARERAHQHLLDYRREIMERYWAMHAQPGRTAPVPLEIGDPGKANEGFAPPVGGFLRKCLVSAARYGAMTTTIFLPFGLFLGVLSWDWRVMLPIMALGAILGVLMGSGGVVLDRIFEPKPMEAVKPLLDPDFGPASPPWWKPAAPGRTTISREDAKQRAGRWKRMLFGAMASVLLVGYFFTWAALTSPMPAASGFVPAFLVLIGIVGLIGGIAGALTESR